MSKTKQKTHRKTEHLEGEIRSLKSQLRQARRRVRELEKKSHFYEEIIDDVVEDIESKNICEHCGKGELLAHDFNYVVVVKCNLCDYKETRRCNAEKKDK
jgi:predicted RNase H-like nuclease (RuvC/YqgF family)